MFSILKGFIKKKNLMRATRCRKCDIFMYFATVVVFPEGHSTFPLIATVPLLFLFCPAAPLVGSECLLSRLPSGDC